VENFLLGARLMGFTEQRCGVTQGGQETDVGCAVRSAPQEELCLWPEEKVREELFIYFSAMLSRSCFYLAQNCTGDEAEDSTGVRFM